MMEGILLPYQQRVIAACEQHDVVVIEKSRRIGITWTLACFALLEAAGGRNVFYLGYNLDMTRDFISTVEGWAKGLDYALGSETLFLDEDDKEAVQALKVKTKSGARIHALTSKPRSLRGKQGLVIIDEATSHDDLDGVMQAALPLLMLGGKVVVLSTHLGKLNAFYALCENIRKGREPYHLMRITFADALADGFYRMVCRRDKSVYSREAEAEYEKYIRSMMKNPGQELDCIAADAEGVYFSRVLLESRSDKDVAVVRWQKPEGFDDTTAELRGKVTEHWIGEFLSEFAFGDYRRFGVGIDVGRHHDLTVIWVFGVSKTLRRDTVLVIELKAMHFDCQLQVMQAVLKALPKSFIAQIDKTGIGEYLCEALTQIFGTRVIGVVLRRDYYGNGFPRIKAALEDESIVLPADDALIDDLHRVAVVNGLTAIPKKTGQQERHADGAVACLLGFDASDQDSWRVEYHVPEGAERETERGLHGYETIY